MDQLREYVKLDIPEDAMPYIRSMIGICCNISLFDDYDINKYREIDSKLHESPYVDDEKGVQINNLKDFCEYFAKDFDAGMNTPVHFSKEDDAFMREDPSAYMATHFGIAY